MGERQEVLQALALWGPVGYTCILRTRGETGPLQRVHCYAPLVREVSHTVNMSERGDA